MQTRTTLESAVDLVGDGDVGECVPGGAEIGDGGGDGHVADVGGAFLYFVRIGS